jgi:hypothetical protein
MTQQNSTWIRLLHTDITEDILEPLEIDGLTYEEDLLSEISDNINIYGEYNIGTLSDY